VQPSVVFPEHFFPTNSEWGSDYRRLLTIGQCRMRQSTAVISGLARNVAEILPVTIARIERIGESFGDYRVVIYENDSHDETRSLLLAWAKRNPRVRVIVETIGDPVNPCARCLQRAARMANYRNRCLDVIREEFADFDYALMLDTDLKGGWSYDGIANTFGHDHWDFVGSNGIIFKRVGRELNVPIQYDAWAFRWDENFSALPTASVNVLRWQRGQPLVPVTSCFGGLGIYRMTALLSARYSGWDSEHIPLHQAMRKKGFNRMFINPSQIALYGRRHRSIDRLMIPLTKGINYLRNFSWTQPLTTSTNEPLCLGMKS
jgi:glycosyltransferase involved in cell wall biosynthesis